MTIVAASTYRPILEIGEQLLGVEAVLDDETLSQTVVRIHDRSGIKDHRVPDSRDLCSTLGKQPMPKIWHIH